MKVNIGKYPDTIRVYKWFDKWLEIHHKKSHWDVHEDQYTKLDKYIEKVFDGIQFCLDNTINKFVNNRKIDIRIDKYDTWSMDHTLALIILPMLKQLKETNHGAPHVDDEDVPEELRSTSADAPKKNEWDTDSLYFKRWDWVMDQMIWAFEQIVDPDEGHTNYYDNGVYNPEKYKEYNEKVKKALILFGKYYRGLWD